MSDATEKPSAAVQQILTAPYVLEYSYKRSLGPVIGRFFASLGERRIEGIRTASGKVMVPPTEYDPDTGEALSEFVEVGSSGVVTSWTWVPQPRASHPLPTPFAFALVRLDGADTAMLHVVEAKFEAMKTGMRVTARFADEPSGSIRDLAAFVPEPPPDEVSRRMSEKAHR